MPGCLNRDLVLSPDPVAARRARRLVRETLRDADHVELSDAAELAVSELVTNAALHARTSVELRIRVGAGAARVEVRDFNVTPPRQRHYGERATTGRGMAVVASVTSSCGVTALPDGKIVWFVVRRGQPERSVDDVLAAFDDTVQAPGAGDGKHTDGHHLIRLIGIPPTLWLATRRHHDALLRELGLYVARHDDVDVDLAGTELAKVLFSNAVMAAVEDSHRIQAAAGALPDGHPSPQLGALPPLDLDLELPLEAGAAAAAMQDTLDTAEMLAGEGRLLTFPGQPELVAVRDWLCEQVQSQLNGVAPRAWPGTSDERFETATKRRGRDPREGVAAVVELVGSSERGVVASDEGNRILAISSGLASALGWQVEDLVGRRVVVLIPPSLREAHVAGFSRHLSTGESNILGVPLTLPVLRSDGAEITCEFVVEQVTATAGRSVYLAWITPANADVPPLA